MERLKVIITGATGMIGEGVLYECLHCPEVEKILVISRQPCGYSHPKLTEIIHDNFFDFSSLTDHLKGYHACYFCLGVTSAGKNEADYTRLTHTITMTFAATLANISPEMTFCYISGAGTDSSEKGRIMWARVKGKTENDLVRLPFRRVYNFRPAGIEPFLPLRPSQTYSKIYKYVGWLLPVMKVLAPNSVISLKDFAAAMINSSLVGFPRNIIEMKDLKELARVKVRK